MGLVFLGGDVLIKREIVGRQGAYEITIKEVPQQLLAAARQRTTFARISAEIGRLLEPVWALIKTERPDLRKDGHNVALYWDETGDGSIEVGVQVVKKFEDTDAVVNSATPAGSVATTAHFGSYDQLGRASDAVRAWCQTNGYALAGPFWEVFGDWEDDPAKLRTDVFYLVK
jgi:effector-binding domain-containing protein